jgi:phenylpropionate dioxygenase-like ring-hydroxylating dioxygenase large terminal subunit
MGPSASRPPLRKFVMFDQPGLKMGQGGALGGNLKPCNWLQITDNVVDPVHEAYLHASISGVQFKDATGRLVEELADRGVDDCWETGQGITCNVAHRVGDTVWVRSMEYVCPKSSSCGGCRCCRPTTPTARTPSARDRS